MSSWLELGPNILSDFDENESKMRQYYTSLTVECINVIFTTDPSSKEYILNLKIGGQLLVESAYFSLGLIRSPAQVWYKLNSSIQTKIIQFLKSTRKFIAPANNWLLFSAIVETAIWKYSGDCEISKIEVAVNSHFSWYVGDGTYGDGSSFHWDYYNSYVIHPMLLVSLEAAKMKNHSLGNKYNIELVRAQRYAIIQERMISPEGTYPIIGCTSTVRFGAFQTLSMLSLWKLLPSKLEPRQVRSALTAVIHRMMTAPNTFDSNGWLLPGVIGYQPNMTEFYISRGSGYHATNGLLHLGLPPNDAFWIGDDCPWTQKSIWSGIDIHSDHALD